MATKKTKNAETKETVQENSSDIESVGTENAEKEQTAVKKYGRGGKMNFPNARLKEITETEDGRSFLAKAIHNNHAFFKIGLQQVKSEEELCERINFFFEECERTKQLPTWEKLCLCIGYDRNSCFAWSNGTQKPYWGTGAVQVIIKKAREILSALDAELASHGKIQPVVYFFRAKNFYEMRDQTEYIIKPDSPLGEINAEEARRELEGLPDMGVPYEGTAEERK